VSVNVVGFDTSGVSRPRVPITARVSRSMSWMAAETPMPTPSPLVTFPAHVIWVSSEPAYTSAQRPETFAPDAMCASVSLFWMTSANVPETASLPPLAPAWAKLNCSSASRAPRLKPPCLPLQISAASSTIACVWLSTTITKIAPPKPPRLPPEPAGLMSIDLSQSLQLPGVIEPDGSLNSKTPVTFRICESLTATIETT
jgi:hypothetical protein